MKLSRVPSSNSWMLWLLQHKHTALPAAEDQHHAFTPWMFLEEGLCSPPSPSNVSMTSTLPCKHGPTFTAYP